MSNLKYIDLFAGAGGLPEGFIREQFEPIAHVEMSAKRPIHCGQELLFIIFNKRKNSISITLI